MGLRLTGLFEIGLAANDANKRELGCVIDRRLQIRHDRHTLQDAHFRGDLLQACAGFRFHGTIGRRAVDMQVKFPYKRFDSLECITIYAHYGDVWSEVSGKSYF